MTARQFYDWQTNGGVSDVIALVEILEKEEVSWCMIGGLAVNHWAEEPMATADVDLVISTNDVSKALGALQKLNFEEKHFEYSVNFRGGSKVSIQISTAEFYQDFPVRSVPADVHGILMRVASLEDTLAEKVAAYSDDSRRPSKRQKDLADISRLLEAHPQIKPLIPEHVQQHLIS